MARRSNLTALAALGTLGYMLSKKGDKKDDKKTEGSAIENLPVARPSMKPREIERNLDDDLYSDSGPRAGRSSSETVSAPKKPVASGKPAVKIPTKPASGTASKVRDYEAEQQADNPIGSRSMVGVPGTLDEKGITSETRAPRFTPNEPPVQTGRREFEESQIAPASVDETKLSANERLKRSIERNLSGFRRGSTPTDYRPVNERFKKGGAVKGYASGGTVSSASKRADGIATKGKTRGKIC